MPRLGVEQCREPIVTLVYKSQKQTILGGKFDALDSQCPQEAISAHELFAMTRRKRRTDPLRPTGQTASRPNSTHERESRPTDRVVLPRRTCGGWHEGHGTCHPDRRP